MTVVFVLAAALAAAPPDAGAVQPPSQPAAAPVSASAPNNASTGNAPPAAVTSYPPGFFKAVAPNTALDMINNLPGFTLDTGDTVRGFEGAAGNVLIDGERPASKTDTLDQVLQRIPAGSVARIDVIRGGAPGIDMHGKTIIANVIRANDDGLKVTAALAGDYDTSVGKTLPGVRLEGSKRTGDTSFEAALLWGIGGDDGTGNGARTVRDATGAVTQTAYERVFGEGMQGKLQGAVETPVEGGKLRIEASIQHNPYTYKDGDTLIDPPGSEYERYTQGQDLAEVGLRYEHPLGPRASVEAFALQQVGNADYVDDLQQNDFGEPPANTFFSLDKRTGESILHGVWKFTESPTLSLEAGAEGAFNWLDSKTLETFNAAPVFVPAANVHVEEKRGEAFATATWRPLTTLTAEGGMKVEASAISSTGDVVSADHFLFPKPRVLLTWSPESSDQFRLRVEREVSQLDFNDFAASGSLGTGTHAGNPQLTPQQDWVIEGAYERRFWGGGDASVTLRRYWLTDVIDWAPTCGQPVGQPLTCGPDAEYDEPANVGNGWKDELAVAVSLPTDKLFLPSGLLTVRSTWRLSGVIDPSTHLQREISGLHPVDAEIHFTQNLPKLKSTWGFDIFPSWRQTYYHFSEVDTDRLGTWVGFFFEYKPKPDFALRAEFDNASGRGFEHTRAFYDPFRDDDGGVLSSVDDRHPRFGPVFHIRARKTFG